MSSQLSSARETPEDDHCVDESLLRRHVIDATNSIVKLWDAKLWSLYRHLGQSEFLDLEGDWSDDVDSPEEYEEFWPALQDQAIHDAL